MALLLFGSLLFIMEMLHTSINEMPWCNNHINTHPHDKKCYYNYIYYLFQLLYLNHVLLSCIALF